MKFESQSNTVLDAIERLSEDEQETLLDIGRRRLARRGRQRVVREVQEARREFVVGQLKPMSVNENMDEINS